MMYSMFHFDFLYNTCSAFRLQQLLWNEPCILTRCGLWIFPFSFWFLFHFLLFTNTQSLYVLHWHISPAKFIFQVPLMFLLVHYNTLTLNLLNFTYHTLVDFKLHPLLPFSPENLYNLSFLCQFHEEWRYL